MLCNGGLKTEMRPVAEATEELRGNTRAVSVTESNFVACEMAWRYVDCNLDSERCSMMSSQKVAMCSEPGIV